MSCGTTNGKQEAAFGHAGGLRRRDHLRHVLVLARQRRRLVGVRVGVRVRLVGRVGVGVRVGVRLSVEIRIRARVRLWVEVRG